VTTTRAGTRPLAATPPTLPGWLQAGRATTLPARKGLAYCRIDGLVGALPAPETLLFSGLPGVDEALEPRSGVPDRPVTAAAAA
jgi:hypothetical protein